MSRKEAQHDESSPRTVLYEVPGMERVRASAGNVYRKTSRGPLTMDIYRLIEETEDRSPAVILVAGYPDEGYERLLGCKFKDTGSSRSWARLIAASGLVAITYTNIEPLSDARALLAFTRSHAESLGIDSSRVGLLATSGNVPLALFLAQWDALSYIACAALCYGYMPDDVGSTRLAEAASKWHFTNPFEETATESLRRDVPLLVARAGRDEMPNLNTTLDRFVGAAIARNLPMTFVNHPEGPHAFDLFHDSEATRAVIRQTLAFLRAHLT